jgi:hypothetical protein
MADEESFRIFTAPEWKIAGSFEEIYAFRGREFGL